jgi:hypothetical protein
LQEIEGSNRSRARNLLVMCDELFLVLDHAPRGICMGSVECSSRLFAKDTKDASKSDSTRRVG